MTHYTVNDTSTSMAAEYAGIAIQEKNERELDAILRDSERYVQYYAPAPDPLTEEYTQAAQDGEMRVFKYLANTEGIYTGSSISGLSQSFIDFEKVERIIKRTVGLFADSSMAGGGADVAYIERFR